MDIEAELGISSDNVFQQLVVVSWKNIDDWWPEVLRLLRSSRETWEEYCSEEGLRKDLKSGYKQLWLGISETGVDLAAISQFDNYEKIKVIRVIWVAGEGLQDAIDYLSFIELWGSKMGCRKCEVTGRKGWKRALAPYGYKQSAVVLQRDISNMTVQ